MKKLWLLFLWQSLACCLAFGRQSAPLPARVVTSYALTSVRDFYDSRDPSAWRLLASNDGHSWDLLDVRTNEQSIGPSNRKFFHISNQTAYRIYRLQVDANVVNAPLEVGLAEIELMGPVVGVDEETDLQANITSSQEHPLVGAAVNAFDGDATTRWLDYAPFQNGRCWIQCEYVRRSEFLLTNVSQISLVTHLMATPTLLLEKAPQILSNLTVSVTGTARALEGYALTSANDASSRDPKDWVLLGSNDGGVKWETVDVRKNEIFSSRLHRRVFKLAKPSGFALYRLQIPARVQDDAMQLAELEPLYADRLPNTNFSMVISASGDNPPMEKAEMAFDHDNRSKWLCFTIGSDTNVWIQWQCLPKVEGLPLINLDQFHRLLGRDTKTSPVPLPGKLPVLRADSALGIQPGLPRILKLQLDGIAVCADSQTLGFLDKSGFQMLQFESSIPKVEPGDRVRLAGRMRFGKELPLVQDPVLVVLGSLTNRSRIPPGQHFDGQLPFVFDSVEGKAVAISEGQQFSSLRLAPETSTHGLIVKILNPHHVPLPVLAGHRLRVQGVMELVFDEQGRSYYGVMWVAGSDDVTVLPAAETEKPVAQVPETNELTSIHQIVASCQNQPASVFKVRIRGVITYVDLGMAGWYLQNGPDAIFVQSQMASGVNPYLRQEGMYVELQGSVGGTNGTGIVPSAFAKILGKGQMPEPLRPSMDSLAAGNCDGKWVQLDGIVTALEKQRLWLRVGNEQLMIWVNETDWKGEDRMLGSLVSVSGVCMPLFNNRQQRLGVRLLVPSAGWVEVIEAGPENLFNLPTSTIDSLLQSNPSRARLRTPFRKITGVVTYKESQMLFVQTNSEAVRVVPREEVNVTPGDVVEVVGLPALDGFTPKLVQAVIKRNGRVALPAANPIDVQRWGSDNNETIQDGTRSAVQAILLGLSANDSVQILELQQDVTQIPFRAYLPRDPRRLFSLPLGSRVRLEGVAKAKADTVPDIGQVVTTFEMYLNSPADIFVLERPSWWTSRHTYWLLGGLGLILLAALTWIRALRTQVRRRTRELHVVIDQHEQTELQLQAEISERKRMEIEVQKTNKALIDTSRQAGMAEVATSVLHNVGNVLNSVNIASGVIADNLRNSSCARLSKVVALMDEHGSDLGSFLTSDSKGRLIPSYLSQLANHLDQERAAMLNEVDGLRENVEHIKEVVVMQQTYARVSGVTEIVAVAGLVEAAMRADAAVVNDPDVKIIRDDDSGISNITVDKHKVLQILVNVIANAKHACEEAGREEKQITVRVRQGNQRVRISVSDNGVGIPPKNLTKIFNHGFTTRKNGHGFGLHSGALAAKEMGGSLTAHSEGQGFGATFTLELPLQPPKARSDGPAI